MLSLRVCLYLFNWLNYGALLSKETLKEHSRENVLSIFIYFIRTVYSIASDITRSCILKSIFIYFTLIIAFSFLMKRRNNDTHYTRYVYASKYGNIKTLMTFTEPWISFVEITLRGNQIKGGCLMSFCVFLQNGSRFSWNLVGLLGLKRYSFLSVSSPFSNL